MGVKSVNIISDQSLDKYDVIDQNLLPSKNFVRNFGNVDDYIEAHLYTKDDRLINSNYNVREFKILTTVSSESTLANSLEFDPAKYIQDLGYKVGDFKLEYRIFRKKLFTISSPTFFISEISKDRTEIRLTSNIVSDATLEENTLNFLYEIQSSQYFKDFLLNFGNNDIVNAVNIALDKNKNPYSVIIKLYRALPTEFNIKSSLWVVEELADPIVFEVELVPDPVVEQVQFLGPANFNVEVESHKSVGSTYQSLDSIYNTSDIQAYQDVVNKLNTKSATINVDYSDYSNFVHFSSAQQRLNNFTYKLQTIEDYHNDISVLTAVPNYLGSTTISSSICTLQQSVNNLVRDMDGYEKFLYSVTSSASWPKHSGSLLYATNSTEGLAWLGSYDEESPHYGGQSYTASLYDLENQDNLTYIVPEYLAIDESNSDYLLFVNMLGQQFDEVWLYIRGMKDLYKAENSVSEGISKDMVFTALRSLGVKVYNSNSNDNIFEYLLGNASGSYTVTGSNSITSGEDKSKEIFKRIYHNLPYLLKSKGSVSGLKGIITSFGIPDTVLSVTEYGGSDKLSDTLEYVTDRFSHGYVCSGNNYAELPWAPLTQNNLKYTQNIYPDSLELRFTPDKNILKGNVTLLQAYNGSTINFGVTMDYTSSAGVPSANINFILQNESSSLTLPICATETDGQPYWWNLLLKRSMKYTTPNTSSYQVYELCVQNSISGKIAHSGSCQIYASGSNIGPINLAWGSDSTLRIGALAVTSSNFISGSSFLGQVQELRLWSEPLDKSYFNLHTLNNESIAEVSSYDNLAARFPLGNSVNLHLSESIHPNVGIDYMTGNNSIQFTGPVNYSSFYELQYNSSNLGPVTDKIRVVDNVVEGNVLSPFLKLETPDAYRTKDSLFTDISFSPQSEIDKDILAQYGTALNLDEFLGDPSVQYNNSYGKLELLKQAYYKKYISNLNYKDFITLVDTFDNSLFKMLQDNTPATANLSTGVTVKSPILERNRIQRHKPGVKRNDYTASIVGQTISAGMPHAELTEGFEFYTGKLSGSLIDLDDKFTENNFNEYALFKEDLDKNKFEHSNFNVLHGNISKQRLSSKFKKIDSENDKILGEVELQDSYYTSKAYLLPRYEGSKSTSRYYNVYSQGDTAYGKNAAIYRNVLKFGYVNPSSTKNLNFYDKTSFNLKYLIDESGSVLELSKQNNNLFEVQNTFKSGETIIISLINPINPSNQAILGGTKDIYEGGYSYSPIFYREINDPLYFTYLSPDKFNVSLLGIRSTITNKNFMEWSGNGDIDLGGNLYYKLLLVTAAQNSVDIPGSTVANSLFLKIGNILKPDYAPSYTVFTYNNASASSVSGSNSSGKWPYNNYVPYSFTGSATGSYNNTIVNDFNFNLSSTSNYKNRVSGSGVQPDSFIYTLDFVIPSDVSEDSGGYITADFSSNFSYYSPLQGNTDGYASYKMPRSSTYNINCDIDFLFRTDLDGGVGYFKVVGIVEKKVGLNWQYVTHTKLRSTITDSDWYKLGLFVNEDDSFMAVSNDGEYGHQGGWGDLQYSAKLKIDNFLVNLDRNDIIRIKFYLMDMAFPEYQQGGHQSLTAKAVNLKFSFPSGYFEITDSLTKRSTQIKDGIIETSPAIFSLTNTSSSLLFNDSASLFYNNTIYNNISSSVSNNYSPIVSTFSFEKGDIIRFNTFENSLPTYNFVKNVITPIVSGSTVIQPLQLELENPITKVDDPNQFSTTDFAFIRRSEDETNVTINFKKPTGEVSPVILIPNNLREDVKNNIANIIQPLKGNLLT